METPTAPATARRLSPFERPEEAPSFELQPRDRLLVELAADHRYITPSHAESLYGDPGRAEHPRSNSNLARRLRLLYRAGYLNRPAVARRERFSRGEIVYALAREGAKLLDDGARADGEDPGFAKRDWNRAGLWHTIEHDLGVATAIVAVRAAARRHGLPAHFTPWHERDSMKLETPRGDRIEPDGHFVFAAEREGRPERHEVYVEVDRGSHPEKLQERLSRYLAWRLGQPNRDEDGAALRYTVAVFAETPEARDSLRAGAQGLGRTRAHPYPWPSVLFASLADVKLWAPESVLSPIFRRIDGDAPVSLLDA